MIRRTSAPAPGFGALVAVLLWSVLSPAFAQPPPIVLDADTTEYDRRNGHVLFTQIRVEQADIVITADRAESADLDFSDSIWHFTGRVRITTSMGAIQAASAELKFRDHRLASATALGDPARFQRDVVDGNARTVAGTARRIELDPGARQLTLTEQATVRDGAREVSGGKLTYLMAEDRLIASSDQGGDERVRIIIAPPEDGEPPAGGGGDGSGGPP